MLHDLHGKRVNACLQFVIKSLHHGPVLREPRHPVKVTGRDSDAEMGLAAFAPAAMSTVTLGFVDDLENVRLE